MKRALISVYHKEGIETVARELISNKWQIISTGGTAKYLNERNIPVQEVADLTKFPSILNGRVKTLHPLIFAPILAKKNQNHLDQLRQMETEKIDLVIVNFYPFEEALKMKEKGLDFMLENIDIGGPAMVRAAAKNFKDTIVIIDKDDYLPITKKLMASTDLEIDQKRQLAQKAFNYTSYYDSLIADYLYGKQFSKQTFFNISGRKLIDLRYGENPHQEAGLYIKDKQSPFYNFEKIQGKQLSFNNILDSSMVYELLNNFQNDSHFVVIVKHQNPCGAAMADSQIEAFRNALSGDPKSAFGGIVGFNKPLDPETAEEVKKIFFEVIVAPDFSANTRQIFIKKKNLRVIKLSLGYRDDIDLKTIPGGFLIQDRDNLLKDADNFELKTSRVLKEKEKQDVAFGWKLIKFVKSNAIIIVKDKMLIGVGAGQMSRVDAVELAIKKSQFPLNNTVLISDAFFPFADSVEIAAQNEIKVIVEPGGSIRDNEVIETAEKNNISLLFTSTRHFRH